MIYQSGDRVYLKDGDSAIIDDVSIMPDNSIGYYISEQDYWISDEDIDHLQTVYYIRENRR